MKLGEKLTVELKMTLSLMAKEYPVGAKLPPNSITVSLLL
jgi:hypothetical protein